LAPAFSPKSVDVLVPHMLAPIREAVGELKSSEADQLDLFAFVHRLALEIAGRTMFSLDMRERGPALWALVARYGERLGRPDLLDLLTAGVDAEPSGSQARSVPATVGRVHRADHG
jgi:cytochrome P450